MPYLFELGSTSHFIWLFKIIWFERHFWVFCKQNARLSWKILILVQYPWWFYLYKGQDWRYGDHDGGIGTLGTVLNNEEGKVVVSFIQWVHPLLITQSCMPILIYLKMYRLSIYISMLGRQDLFIRCVLKFTRITMLTLRTNAQFP